MKVTLFRIANHHVSAILFSSLALASCLRMPPAQIPAVATLSASACLNQEWSPAFRPSSESRPYNLLAGGTVKVKDFVIGIWLYCDPALTSSNPADAEYSEIGRMGLHWEWLYVGPTYEGFINETLVINGETVGGGSSGPRLQSGDTGATTGSIKTASLVAAKAAEAGKPIKFTVRLELRGSVSEGSLTVSLDRSPDGYRLSSAALSAPAR